MALVPSLLRHREFTGPTPHSVAILARPPNKKPAEHLILDRRRKEDLREKCLAETKFNQHCDLKSTWQVNTDRQIQKNCVKRKMGSHLQQRHLALEDRRGKLRSMLVAEEESYVLEMESKEETVQDRQKQMKERAKFLKEKREAERKAFVAQKIEEKFREECCDLRAELSKQTRDKIFADRNDQLLLKVEERRREAEVDAYYTHMWQEDIRRKAEREQQETVQQIERNRSALEVLNMQVKATEIQKEEEKHMKQCEAEWLKEEAETRVKEEELMKKHKMEKRDSTRCARLISLKLQRKKEAKEKQEELAMDMSMLKKVLQDTQNKQAQDLDKKMQDREEMQRFMHYMEKTRREQTEQEEMLEEHISTEVEKQWQKKDERRRKERHVRNFLMQNVLETRKLQIQEREKQTVEERDEALRERNKMNSEMEEYRKMESERIKRVRESNQKYKRDLEQQMLFEQQTNEKELQTIRKELDDMQNAEILYQRRVRSALTKPDRRKQHPFRTTEPRVQSY